MKANKMKVYKVYCDCGGTDVFKEFIPAFNEESAAEYLKGNGEIVAVKEIEIPPFNSEEIAKALSEYKEGSAFCQYDIDVIIRALYQIGIAE